MLQDFYLLELYFGTVESAQSFESLIKKYGKAEVLAHLKSGLLHIKTIDCAHEKLCWLSDKGRGAMEGKYRV